MGHCIGAGGPKFKHHAGYFHCFNRFGRGVLYAIFDPERSIEKSARYGAAVFSLFLLRHHCLCLDAGTDPALCEFDTRGVFPFSACVVAVSRCHNIDRRMAMAQFTVKTVCRDTFHGEAGGRACCPPETRL